MTHNQTLSDLRREMSAADAAIVAVDAKPSSADLAIGHELIDRARSYAEASTAKNTIKAYRSSWRVFCRWAKAHGCDPLPATPSGVATFLADRASSGIRPSTLSVDLAAIGRAHRLRQVADPTKHEMVRTVMQGIRRTHGTSAMKKMAPITVGDLKAMLAVAGGGLPGLRDKAALLLGFCGALRSSEMVAVELNHLTPRSEGLALQVVRSKTDQAGVSRTIPLGFGAFPETCPVIAIRKWVAASGIRDGALLRAVDRHGNVKPGPLTTRTISRRVQRLAAKVGLRGTGSHSLRAGLATSAAAAGVSERAIAEITGHRSLLVLRGYIRSGQLFEHDLVTTLGL